MGRSAGKPAPRPLPSTLGTKVNLTKRKRWEYAIHGLGLLAVAIFIGYWLAQSLMLGEITIGGARFSFKHTYHVGESAFTWSVAIQVLSLLFFAVVTVARFLEAWRGKQILR